jgi:hypothetical protein
VGTNPSRLRRLGVWIIIVPALSLFSFSVVGAAAASRSGSSLESAAAKVVPQARDDGHGAGSNGGGNQGQNQNGNGNGNQNGNHDDGTLVVVDSSHGEGGIAGLFGNGREICWISRSQLVRVSGVYRTTTSTLRVGHKTYSLVTVFGANERTLRQLLGSSAVQCKLVQVARLYFLPLDPNLS